MIEIDDNRLYVGENMIEFENKIAECVEFDSVIIVRLKISGEDYPKINQNVIAIEPDGSLRWRIDLCPDETGGGHDSYSGLFDHDGELWVTNLNGMKYKVDKSNGDIVDKKFVK